MIETRDRVVTNVFVVSIYVIAPHRRGHHTYTYNTEICTPNVNHSFVHPYLGRWRVD